MKIKFILNSLVLLISFFIFATTHVSAAGIDFLVNGDVGTCKDLYWDTDFNTRKKLMNQGGQSVSNDSRIMATSTTSKPWFDNDDCGSLLGGWTNDKNYVQVNCWKNTNTLEYRWLYTCSKKETTYLCNRPELVCSGTENKLYEGSTLPSNICGTGQKVVSSTKTKCGKNKVVFDDIVPYSIDAFCYQCGPDNSNSNTTIMEGANESTPQTNTAPTAGGTGNAGSTGGGTVATGGTGGGAGGNSDGICAGPVPYGNPYTWNTGIKLNSPGHPKHGTDIQCAYSTENDCSNGNYKNLCYGDTVDGKRACVNVKDCASALGEGWSNTEPTCEGDETVVKTTWNCIVYDPSVYIQPCSNNTTCYKCAPKQNTAGSCAEALAKNPLSEEAGWKETNFVIDFTKAGGEFSSVNDVINFVSKITEPGENGEMLCDGDEPPETTSDYIIMDKVKKQATVCAVKCQGDDCTPENEAEVCGSGCCGSDGKCKPASDPECSGTTDCNYIDGQLCCESEEGNKCRWHTDKADTCGVGDEGGWLGKATPQGNAVCDQCTGMDNKWTPYDTHKDSYHSTCVSKVDDGSTSCGDSAPYDKTCIGSSLNYKGYTSENCVDDGKDKTKYNKFKSEQHNDAINSAYCRTLSAKFTIEETGGSSSGSGSGGGASDYKNCLDRAGAGSENYLKLIFNRGVKNWNPGNKCDDKLNGAGHQKNTGNGEVFSVCLNPCECQAEIDIGYTFHLEIGEEFKGENDGRFYLNGDRCEALWSALPDANGIDGRRNKWGEAGTNGRWVFNKGLEQNGWKMEIDPKTNECYFACKGSVNGAPCYSQTLNVPVYFVPDLRVVTYNDPDFQALPTTSTAGGGNCSIGTKEYSGDLTTNFVLDNNKNKRNFRFYLGGPGQASPYMGILTQNSSIAAATSPIDRQIFPTPFTDTGYYTEMTAGESLTGQTVNFSNQITNQYNKAEDTGYWTCTCPYGNQADPDSQNCQFTFVPNGYGDICTTKRVYTSFRNCYTSAWWQVSGGNVYAYSNIVDFVPTQIIGQGTDQQCTSDAYKCVDTTSPAGSANDFPLSETTGAAGEESCTPRVIRGRTPCKNDGPSNSAGIALTQNGSVTTVDYTDCRINGNCANINNDILKVEELARRVTERSNIHALYEGNYTGEHSQNADNPSGLQAKIGNSRVLPYQKANYTQRTDDNYGRVPPQSGNADNGFKPPREDYRYFVALFGGYDKLTDQAGVEVSYGPETAGVREFNSSGLALQNISDWCNREASVISHTDTEDTRVCHIPGNLTITNDAPWRVSATDGVTKNYTFFVEGNLTLKGNNDINNSSSVTAVDIGNFLGFIVNGNIFVDHNVGITMTDPTSDTTVADPLLNACWEGQSATLPGVNLPQADTNAHNNYSTAGSVEGVFITNGNFMVDSIINNANRTGDATCRFDRRFIAQGSIISWGNVYLLRDFNNREGACQGDFYGAYNNRVPAETFIYRPDLVRNTPDWMKRQSVVYTEV